LIIGLFTVRTTNNDFLSLPKAGEYKQNISMS